MATADHAQHNLLLDRISTVEGELWSAQSVLLDVFCFLDDLGVMEEALRPDFGARGDGIKAEVKHYIEHTVWAKKPAVLPASAPEQDTGEALGEASSSVSEPPC